MKCFLSHSSKDKARYVATVAAKLAPNIEYDELTFEEGMGNLEEILLALGRSDIFVLFLSDNSLDSEWVRREITEARIRIETGELKRFFPIVIDRSISFRDARIPQWMSESYNLRPITKPTIAAKRIRERMVEASWKSHPLLKHRDQIFVGRNQHIADFEQRMDDLTKDQPLVLFTSGLRDIGRKSFMRNALRKSNIVRDTYEPVRIDLTQEDNLEGLILKLADFGLSDDVDISNLMTRSQNEKYDICARLISDFFPYKEIIMIEDRYCVVRFDRDIAPWFVEVIDRIDHNSLAICVATSAKAAKHKYIRDDRLYFIELPELQKVEREGLFKRFCDHLEIEMSRDEYKIFSPLLKGFPEQVTYAASLVSELGTKQAFDRSDEIVSFSSYKASIFLKQYDEEEEILTFLRFLSSFDFVSLDFVLWVAGRIGKPLAEFMERFVADSVCEAIGTTGQYFRVNEVIRDAIVRDRTSLEGVYHEVLISFVENFSNNYETEGFDVSEYHIAVKQALSTGIVLPESMMIPAHFLQTMKDLYNKRMYREVIALADRVLQNAEFYDEHTRQDILYYLCQSLARQQDPRFTEEVQKITGPEHDFLFGFYYRLRRRFDDALKRYKSAMKHQRTEQRARREVVFVLTATEAFEEGLSLAKENHERYPSNPFLAQAYFQCLLHGPDDPNISEKLQDVLSALKQIGGTRAQEMHANLSARFEFQFGDRDTAYALIDKAIHEHENIVYPVLTKLDMASHEMNADLISSCLKRMQTGGFGAAHHGAVTKGKAILTALEGDKPRALRIVETDLRELSHTAKEKLIRRIEGI
jgi:tetratricopeptide (TPR) repeat protein